MGARPRQRRYGTGVSTATAVLTVAVAALVVVLAVTVRSLLLTRRDRAGLSEQLEFAETRVSELTQRTTAAEVEAGRAVTKARAQSDRAAAAERGIAAAEERASTAEATSRNIERDLRDRLIDPAALGALEAGRISRLWQETVPGPGEPLPVETHDDVHAALAVLAEASREESGTTVDIDWNLDRQAGPGLALCIVRVAEELIAASRNADTARIEVHANDEGSVLLSLHTEPSVPMPTNLTEVLASTGWIDTLDVGEVVLRLTP